MVEKPQIAVFSDGRASVVYSANRSREVVLALPLGRFLAKVLRIPAESAGETAQIAERELAAMSPFPDGRLTVSCETLAESESCKYVLASAFPEESCDDIAEALDAAKLFVTRIDMKIVGALRVLWPQISMGGRRAVIVPEEGFVDIAVFSGDVLASIRSVPAGQNVQKELLLSLLAAEDVCGKAPVDEIVLVGDAPDASAGLAPTRRIAAPDEQAVLAAICERSQEDGAANALPESWKEALDESRFKRKFRKYLAVAGGLWLVAVAAMFLVPVGYGLAADRIEGMRKAHYDNYAEVNMMNKKVRAVRKYSDHATGALEVLRVICGQLPPGVKLTSLKFDRDKRVDFSGVAPDVDTINALQKALGGVKNESGDAFFAENGIRYDLRGTDKNTSEKTFDMKCSFESEAPRRREPRR